MGDLLPRVMEGGRLVYTSVLCYTFSGGNITLGPGLSRAQITSPISPPSPDSVLSLTPGPVLTRPGHQSPGLPARCSLASLAWFSLHSASWEGAGVRATLITDIGDTLSQ